MNHVIRPAARDDIIRQYRYYLVDREAPDLAERFLEAVEEAIEQVLRMPGIGAPKQLSNAALTGLRFWHICGFEHMHIYYLIKDDTLRVVRVLHGKRDIQRILEQESGDESCH